MTTKIINEKLFYVINDESEFVDYLLNKSSTLYNTDNNYVFNWNWI